MGTVSAIFYFSCWNQCSIKLNMYEKHSLSVFGRKEINMKFLTSGSCYKMATPLFGFKYMSFRLELALDSTHLYNTSNFAFVQGLFFFLIRIVVSCSATSSSSHFHVIRPKCCETISEPDLSKSGWWMVHRAYLGLLMRSGPWRGRLASRCSEELLSLNNHQQHVK